MLYAKQPYFGIFVYFFQQVAFNDLSAKAVSLLKEVRRFCREYCNNRSFTKNASIFNTK